MAPSFRLVLARVVLTQDAAPLRSAARAALEAGDGETAIWLAGRAAALAPAAAWSYVVLALLAWGEAAIDLERRAYRLDPGHAPGNENEAALRRLDRRLSAQPASAVTAAVSAAVRRCLLALDPARAGDLLNQARARLWGEDAGGAVDLARAVRLRPDLGEDAYAFGMELAVAGRIAVAAVVFPALAAVASPPAAMARPMAAPADLVAAVKAGASLATVMIPDPFIPTNWPEYLEGYCFDHVVASEGCFWALPQPIRFDPPTATATAFAYCGDHRLLIRYTGCPDLRTPAMAAVSHYPGDAYRHFRFVVRHDHALVYDHARPADVAGLDAAIRAAVPLRLVLDTGDGLVHVLPVHLCFLYRESGDVRVLTEMRYVPELCLTPAERLWPYLSSVIGAVDQEHVFAVDTGRDDADGNPCYDLVSLPPGVTPADFPLGSIARKLETVEAASRLVLSKLVVHSDGRLETFDRAGGAITRPFATFRLYART